VDEDDSLPAMVRFGSAAMLLSLLGLACQALPGGQAEVTAAASSGETAEPPDTGKAAAPELEARPKHGDPNRSYSLPFVRDPTTEHPEDRAHGFLRELTRDNAAFAKSHDARFFKPFVDEQKPRATVIACSDSRVQSPAFDATPENDLFTIRNIGNQLTTAEGSVDYGIEHLMTPVLLIVGHSGCGAVKAAMGDFSREPETIRHELQTLQVAPAASEKTATARGRDKSRPVEGQAWIDAVIANVHHQVAAALASYSERVAARDLMVVGAVYDFRNDMRQGFGKLNIVDVNGHGGAAQITAFLRAIDDRLPSGDGAAPSIMPTSAASAAHDRAPTALAPTQIH
jgi:carbonic anhydrase